MEFKGQVSLNRIIKPTNEGDHHKLEFPSQIHVPLKDPTMWSYLYHLYKVKIKARYQYKKVPMRRTSKDERLHEDEAIWESEPS